MPLHGRPSPSRPGVHFALAHRLHLRAAQDETRLDRIQDLVVVPRLAVLRHLVFGAHVSHRDGVLRTGSKDGGEVRFRKPETLRAGPRSGYLHSRCTGRFAAPHDAQVAELVDAHDSGSCGLTPVGVQIPSWAPCGGRSMKTADFSLHSSCRLRRTFIPRPSLVARLELDRLIASDREHTRLIDSVR